MAYQTSQDLDLYPIVKKKERSPSMQNTKYKLDIGQQGTICRTTKSMRQ
jgi:hypothetical protein